MKEIKITKEKFEAYVKVQESGITNMFDIKKVMEISDFIYNVPLTKEDCIYIMENYSVLKGEYK